MNSRIMRIVGRLLIISMLALPFQTVHAGMIGTTQALSAANTDAQRAGLVRTMARADVTSQLQTLGVDAKSAQERVAAMTDAEVQSLANQVNALPAGADNAAWGWAILIALVIWAWYSYR